MISKFVPLCKYTHFLFKHAFSRIFFRLKTSFCSLRHAHILKSMLFFVEKNSYAPQGENVTVTLLTETILYYISSAKYETRTQGCQNVGNYHGSIYLMLASIFYLVLGYFALWSPRVSHSGLGGKSFMHFTNIVDFFYVVKNEASTHAALVALRSSYILG